MKGIGKKYGGKNERDSVTDMTQERRKERV
jgi:hypothetical protein